METTSRLPTLYNPDDYFTAVPDNEELCVIAASTDIGVAGSTEGTVFPTSINETKINSLFDTGATKSVMSGEMYKRLKLGPLNTTRLPKVVGANGASLGAMGRISCEINIGEQTFKQTFLVCQNITRPVILGKDFTRDNCAGVHWTENNTRMLTINLKKLIETPELLPRKTKYAVSLKKAASLPPRSCAVVDVNINTNSKEKVKMIQDELCQSNNPNMYMYSLHADLAEKREDTVTPYVIINLSRTENLYLPNKHFVAFAEKDDTDGKVFEIDSLDTAPRNWVPERTRRSFAQFSPIGTETDLHKVLTMATNFIKSPAEVETHRKVDLKAVQSRRKPKASSAIYVIDLTALFPKAVETLAKHCSWKWT